MKALILKDLYVLFNQKKILISLTAIFVFMSFYFEDPGLLLTFLTLLCIIEINSSLTYDETSKWNRFANTLPIKRTEIVKSKYVLSLIFIVLVVIISLPVFLISNAVTNSFTINEIFSIFCIIISGLLFILSIIFPVFIKFGIQTGRIVLMATVLIPFVGINIVSNGTFFNGIFELLNNIRLFIPLFLIVMFYISYKLSVKLYEKKEF